MLLRVPVFKLGALLEKLIAGVVSIVDTGGEVNKNDRIVVFKMDVEGDEYPIIEEIVAYGIICKMTTYGIKFRLLLAFHSFAKSSRPLAPDNAMETYLYLTKRCGGVVQLEPGDAD